MSIQPSQTDCHQAPSNAEIIFEVPSSVFPVLTEGGTRNPRSSTATPRLVANECALKPVCRVAATESYGTQAKSNQGDEMWP
jgi:hypothetical protein